MLINTETVVASYVKSREEIKVLEEQIKGIKIFQRKKEDWLLNQLQTLGAQNLKTNSGTCYISVRESVSVADWDAVVDYAVVSPIEKSVRAYINECDKDGVPYGALPEVIKAALQDELLTHGISKAEVLSRMGEKREFPPIPGANYSSTKVIGIRKS